jgi:hypothetical protein
MLFLVLLVIKVFGLRVLFSTALRSVDVGRRMDEYCYTKMREGDNQRVYYILSNFVI